MTCKQNFANVVNRTIRKAQAYIDGLCLDCINSSQSKTSSVDDDYWRHATLKGYEIVNGCRVESHSQPTWYFSFMGRREQMEHYRRENRERRASTSANQEPSF